MRRAIAIFVGVLTAAGCTGYKSLADKEAEAIERQRQVDDQARQAEEARRAERARRDAEQPQCAGGGLLCASEGERRAMAEARERDAAERDAGTAIDWTGLTESPTNSGGRCGPGARTAAQRLIPCK